MNLNRPAGNPMIGRPMNLISRRRLASWITVAAGCLALTLGAGCASKKVNETYKNGPAPNRYLVVKVKIYLARSFPDVVKWYQNLQPVRTIQDPDDFNQFELWFDVNAGANQKVHIGCEFREKEDVTVTSVRWTNGAPPIPPPGSPSGSATGTTLQVTDDYGLPGMQIVLSEGPDATLMLEVSNPSEAGTGTNWLQALEYAGSDMDIDIDNLNWGDPLVEALDWNTPSGPSFPVALDPGSSAAVFTAPASDYYAYPYHYIRYKAALGSPGGDSDQETVMQGGLESPPSPTRILSWGGIKALNR